MGFMSPDYIKKNPKFSSAAASYEIVPNTIRLLEPVVAEGQIVFAEDEFSNLDVVMASSEEIMLTISQV